MSTLMWFCAALYMTALFVVGIFMPLLRTLGAPMAPAARTAGAA